MRIGLNAGEPIAEDDPGGRGDLFGASVNMAARIAGKAGGGEILASYVVRELVAGKEFLSPTAAKRSCGGLEDPVRVYEVRWREEQNETQSDANLWTKTPQVTVSVASHRFRRQANGSTADNTPL